MNPVDGLIRAWRWSVRKVLGLWVRTAIKPDDAAAAIAARPRPVCYVVERKSQTDLAVLSMVCTQLSLPGPEPRLPLGERRADKASFALIRPAGLFTTRHASRAARYLIQLIGAAAAHPQFDVDLVPVAIFWGRAPHKEASLWRLLFAEDWVLVGRFRKVLGVLVNGRDILVHFGEPVRLRDALQDGMSRQRSVRWVLRNLRAGLRAQRAATIGPDLSPRRTLVAQLLRPADVRSVGRRDMQARGLTRRAALLAARKNAIEIAANYSQSFVRFMSVALGWLWNRLYDGVDFEHVDKMN